MDSRLLRATIGCLTVGRRSASISECFFPKVAFTRSCVVTAPPRPSLNKQHVAGEVACT